MNLDSKLAELIAAKENYEKTLDFIYIYGTNELQEAMDKGPDISLAFFEMETIIKEYLNH